MRKAKKEKRLQNWDEKALHGQYVRKTKARSEQIWVQLQNGDLNRQTRSLIVAAQNQSIRTSLGVINKSILSKIADFFH